MTRLRGRPFALIGVNVLEYDAKKLGEVMEAENLNWRSTADPGKVIAAKWNQPGTPLYYVLDARGVIRYKWLGYPGEQALDTALETLIQQLEADPNQTAK